MSYALQKVVRDLQQHGNQIIRKLTAELHRELLLNTPIDTGHCQSNWIVSHGAPTVSVVGSKQHVDATTAPASLAAVLGARDLLKSTTYICNNVHYVGALNDGYSPQQPAGFVERAILVSVARLR